MVGNILYSIHTIRDAIFHKTLLALLHEQVYARRIIVPITMDLTQLVVDRRQQLPSDFKFIELSGQDLKTNKLAFSYKSRHYKALLNIKKGLRGFGLLHNSYIIGDIWCDSLHNLKFPKNHKELSMIGIPFKNGDVYVLDIFVDPAFRGQQLAVPIYRSLQLVLKNEGWEKMYAYYYEDNIPSRWMHWMLKFTELPKIIAYRFFFFKKSYPYDSPVSTSR
jgi:hypothetical protein